jgi:RNA polymerase sigma-70 factor (ECF subfamily)
MASDTDDFQTLLRGVQAGDPVATDTFCREYQRPILRVVRRTLLPQYRSRYDSLDFVNDVWASFFASPPRNVRFDDPQSLVAYLARMARNKIGEVRRRHGTAKNDVDREKPLDVVARTALGGGLPAPDATPSQIVGAEDEFQQMLRDRSPVHRGILKLLREGMTYREIADRLNTNEKTIQRLIRRLDPEARPHAVPAHRP